MSDSTRKQFVQGIAAAAGAGLAAWGVTRLLERFRQDTDERVITLYSHSRVYHTAAGPVEAAIFGEGPAVLVVHGAAGGYDQGSVKAEEFTGVKYISVSRPGYLRTPLSTGVTAEEQADALVALLDTLGIEKAAFIGTSTGGLVGIHFALKYPERCWALVLLSSVNAPLHIQLAALKGISPLVQTDFLPWMLMHPETLMLIHPNLRKQAAHNPEMLKTIEQILKTAYPTSMRLSGMLNDATMIENVGFLPLEDITVPTLVIHGDADDTVPFSQGVESASRIPGAQFIPISGGTHYCALTHLELTRPAIMKFLEPYAPEKFSN